MEKKELYRENTYRNLSEEQRLNVLSLIYAYVSERNLPISHTADGKVIEVFLGIMKWFISWK